MNIALSGNEKYSLISNLGTMMSAGIPIMEAVESLLREAKGGQQAVLEIIKKDLNQGKTLADTLAKAPHAFDPVTVNLIKAAEEAGNLDTTLKDLSLAIKKDIEFNDRVRSALAYPMLVMVVFAGVLLLILTFVIPRIATVFSRLKVELPLPTKILIAVSNLLTSQTIWVVSGLVILIVGGFLLYRAKRSYFIEILFSLPLLSTLALEIDLTRFSRSMSLLLSSGIPVTEALDLSKSVVSRKDFSLSIKRSQEMVSSGKNLAESLKNFHHIPGVVLRMIEAGEKSGSLDKAMQEISEHFDSQVSTTLKTLVTIIEPVLLVLIAVLVGGMMLAIIAPIYGLIGQLKGR